MLIKETKIRQFTDNHRLCTGKVQYICNCPDIVNHSVWEKSASGECVIKGKNIPGLTKQSEAGGKKGFVQA